MADGTPESFHLRDHVSQNVSPHCLASTLPRWQHPWMTDRAGSSYPPDPRVEADLSAGFYDASHGQVDELARRRVAIDHMLSLEAPAEDWDVMKAQILESRYPPLPE
jgi:hypothetical protein